MITVIFMLIDQSVTVGLSLISIAMYLFFGLEHSHCRKCCDDDNDDRRWPYYCALKNFSWFSWKFLGSLAAFFYGHVAAKLQFLQPRSACYKSRPASRLSRRLTGLIMNTYRKFFSPENPRLMCSCVLNHGIGKIGRDPRIQDPGIAKSAILTVKISKL